MHGGSSRHSLATASTSAGMYILVRMVIFKIVAAVLMLQSRHGRSGGSTITYVIVAVVILRP